MLNYISKRLLALIPVIIISAIIAFFITNIMPGDPVRLMVGDFATEKQVAEMRTKLGLDRPIYERFGGWLGNVAKGDLGESLFLHEPVTKAIFDRLEPTLLLAVVGMFFGIVIGIPLGIIAAMKHRTIFDQLAISTSLIGMTIPSFFIAIILILVFGVNLQWFPVAGYEPYSKAGFGVIRFLVMPGFAIGLMQSALIARMTRSAMLDVLGQDYIRTARAKGLSEFKVILPHAFKNSLNPIVTVIGFSLATLLGGTWIIETVFNIPGVGALAIKAILNRDYPLIQGSLIFTVVIYLLVNLLVDISYSFINPYIKYK
ncbi:ABC transporter permease [Candidatus Chlorohelix sp.]|uniref:ABC transporter permease n=1 Tax=Candidatus Chlorohelix sp. TaxID=3139201 RepID=UPI003059DBC9